MKIIIVGCGKVGTTIAEELYHEGHDITVIDQNAATVQTITENIDVMGLFIMCRSRLAFRMRIF